jgi:hypothetical protein
MPYYNAGDYYRGDYYRGDFLGIGKAIKRLAGPVLRIGAGLLTGGTSELVRAGLKVGAGLIGRPPGMALTTTSFGGISAVPAAAEMEMIPSFKQTFAPRRRMNVTNVRALRRAGRRVKGFLKIARRLGALPVGGSGKKLFKAKRRKCA